VTIPGEKRVVYPTWKLGKANKEEMNVDPVSGGRKGRLKAPVKTDGAGGARPLVAL
jgi:hypothetical protein